MIVIPAAFQHADAGHTMWQRQPVDLNHRHCDKISSSRKIIPWTAGTGDIFDPERWMVNASFDPDAGPSLPFSIGPRSCFGKKLATLELRLAIAHLTLAFFFAPLEDRLNSQDTYEVIATHAKQTFVKVEKW